MLIAGCETTHFRTARAADTLDHRAGAFAARTCLEPNTSSQQHLRSACAFADQAYEFRQTLGNAGDQEIVLVFQRLWRSYHALRDEVDGLHDRQLRADLKPVTQAFVDVQRHVKNGYSYADPTLYASGGYALDPYYN